MALATEKMDSILTLGDNIHVIVITGGPCSGKTTGMVQLSRRLADRGYKVLISPESATKLITAGLDHRELDKVGFQQEIFLDTLGQEDRIFSIAKRYRDNGRKVVVLCDRGAMDGEAYMHPDQFTKMIRGFGYTHRDLCDGRYHAVIHLRTAALGAEEFYTVENNAARTETPRQARALDKRTLNAWARHQHPRVIDNSTDFKGKLHRLLAEVCAILGDPVPFEKEDKFLIESFDPRSLPVKWYESHIHQRYLLSSNALEERRVRARGDDTGISYYYTIKREVSTGVRTEDERMITEREYRSLLTLGDPTRKTIIKRRICFFHGDQFFEVDVFERPRKGLVLMEAERTDRAPKLKLPPFIKVVKNVTGDKRYSNAEIARTV